MEVNKNLDAFKREQALKDYIANIKLRSFTAPLKLGDANQTNIKQVETIRARLKGQGYEANSAGIIVILKLRML